MTTYFDLLPRDLLNMIEEYKKAMNRNNLILYKFWDLFIGQTNYGYNREIKSILNNMNAITKKYGLHTRFKVGYFNQYGSYFIDIDPVNEEFIADQSLIEVLNKYTKILNIRDSENKTKFNNYCRERGSTIKVG